MQFEHLGPSWAEAVGSGVAPNVGAIPAELPELDVVGVASASDPPNEDKLMLRAVERPHSPVAFGPDAEIEEVTVVTVGAAAGRQHLKSVAPVHEHEVHRTRNANARHILEDGVKKADELGLAH